MSGSPYRNETVVAEATFRKKEVLTYWSVSTAIVLAFTVVGLLLLIIIVPLIRFIGPKIIDTWSCTLTNRAVHVRKGLFIKVRKTIPLEKITDVGSVQGPVMRRYDLHALSFETAGQSGGGTGGALVKLLGIEDSDAFRELVLDTRDAAHRSTAPIDATVPSRSGDEDVLRDIRDSLHRIEEHLRP